jgi:CRP-like cAMP-binding protein
MSKSLPTPAVQKIGSSNRLLAALHVVAPRTANGLQPHLEPKTFELGEVLAPAGESLSHAFFPETAVISVINRMSDGGAVEVGTVGNEGMVDVSHLLAGEPSPNETLAQIPGAALSVPATILQECLEVDPAARSLFNRYTQAYLAQVAQTAACNRLHSIEKRCARWLLMTHDRVDRADRFPLTQEFLAIMLGVRRAGVTVAANAMQDAGLIRYRRGSIRVTDREGLEAAACECYAVVRRYFDNLVPKA